jgi:hypothetical protein
VDVIVEGLYGGAQPDILKIWIARGVLLVALIVAYALARGMHRARAESA